MDVFWDDGRNGASACTTMRRMAESMADTVQLETLAKELVRALPRFRGPVEAETVLADFARAVDLFLTKTSRAGLAREKQDLVLASVHQLLGADRSSIRTSDRFIIACQILHQCAQPEIVTCGAYATSAAATLEYLLYLTEPQIVAGIVCDMAISGQWKSPAGNVVRVHRMNLLPILLPMVDFVDETAADCTTSFSTDVSVRPRGIDRSYASHIAQLVLTNEMLSVLPGAFRYVVTKSVPDGELNTIIEEALYSDGRFVELFAGVSVSHVRRCAEMLMGRDVLLSVIDEVKLFDLLCSSSVLPLIAVVATVNGGIEWIALKSFTASQGRVMIFNPRESGQLAAIGLRHFAQRIR
jgi:hypothetical protein